MELAPNKSMPCEQGSHAVRYLLFWSVSGEVDIARVLHLLEHAQNFVAVFHGRNHGGSDARKEDRTSRLNWRTMFGARFCMCPRCGTCMRRIRRSSRTRLRMAGTFTSAKRSEVFAVACAVAAVVSDDEKRVCVETIQ